MRDDNLPPILPAGTAVVVRKAGADGVVATIVASPAAADGAYRVRLVGGEAATLRRGEMAVLKHFQRDGLDIGQPASQADLKQYVIYRCVVGSRAYGLDQPGSDVDRRGVYLPPARLHWSLHGVPGQIEDAETDECYWELGKFLELALKANPNVLEVLYSPLVEHVTPIAQELLAMRSAFLSKLVYQTYNGYVLSQFKKLEQDLRNRGVIRWKHAMHLIRLLLSGITVLREGLVPLRIDAHRDRLLAIRDGREPWEQVDAWRLDLHRQFDAAFATTALPDRPDYEAVNAFLIRARLSMVGA